MTTESGKGSSHTCGHNHTMVSLFIENGSYYAPLDAAEAIEYISMEIMYSKVNLFLLVAILPHKYKLITTMNHRFFPRVFHEC